MNKVISILCYCILSIGLMAIVVAYIIAAKWQYLGTDSAYYIGTVQQMLTGKSLYVDIKSAYPPIGFFMLYPIASVTNNVSIFLLYNFLLYFASAFILGYLVYRTIKSKLLAYLSSVLFLLTIYYCEGVFIQLEPYVLFWGILSFLPIYEVKKTFLSCFLAGFFAAMAFLSKQYGLIYFGTCVTYLLCEESKINIRFKNIISLLVGFMIVLMLFVAWMMTNGIEIESIVDFFIGGGYGTRTRISYFIGWKGIIKLALMLAALPIIFFFNHKNKIKNQTIIFCLVGIGLSSLQFFFQPYKHYAILMMPFMVWSLFATTINLKNRRKVLTYLILLSGISCYPIYKLAQYAYKNTKVIIANKPRIEQENNIYEIISCISEIETQNKIVYCHPTGNEYIYGKLTPPLLDKYGYGFGFDSIDVTFEKMHNSDYIIIDYYELKRLKVLDKRVADCICDFDLLKRVENICVYKKMDEWNYG